MQKQYEKEVQQTRSLKSANLEALGLNTKNELENFFIECLVEVRKGPKNLFGKNTNILKHLFDQIFDKNEVSYAVKKPPPGQGTNQFSVSVKYQPIAPLTHEINESRIK